MRWTLVVACLPEIRYASHYKTYPLGNLKGRNQIEELGLHENKILKWIFE
jgi:hypothetical protein